MLKKLKEQYANENKQFTLITKAGLVLESDQAIFNIPANSSIFEFHPFFESLPTEHMGKEELNFFCIHLTLKDEIYIVDIKVIPKEEGLLLIFYDLTSHYNTYQSITQTRNESVIKTELTVIKNKELVERERFKNRFIQNFSHELRNPLTSIMAILGLLCDTKLTYEQEKMLDFLKESNTNLRLMLEDTLSIGMIDAGKLNIRNSVFDLHKLIELLDFTYKAKAKAKGLNFECSWDDKLPKYLEGDRLRLFQVVTNILDNALKYTKNGGINFSVVLNQKRANLVNIRFEVADTGLGIAKENQNKIFESFNQVQSNEIRKGVGLGLTIAKKLLELMGSSIKMESTLGEGSRFYFDINIPYILFPKSISNTKSKSKDKNSKQLEKKYKILLVEDDAYVQTTLFKVLLKTNRFKINLVYDGSLVFQEVVNNNYDLILMDVNLPNISGNQITKLIRDFPFKNVKNVPIVGITANALQKDIDQYLEAGMQKVLIKPFENEELLQTIFTLLK